MGILIAAGFNLMTVLPGCSTDKTDAQEADIYITYSAAGGTGVYESGDRYGHKLEIYRNGFFHLYRQIYQGQNEEGDNGSNGSAIQNKLIRDGELDERVMDSLRALIDESDFFSVPARLPNVSPREVEHRTPTETITISLTKDDGTTHRVQSRMSVDSRHYPDDFLTIHRFLRTLQRQLLAE